MSLWDGLLWCFGLDDDVLGRRGGGVAGEPHPDNIWRPGRREIPIDPAIERGPYRAFLDGMMAAAGAAGTTVDRICDEIAAPWDFDDIACPGKRPDPPTGPIAAYFLHNDADEPAYRQIGLMRGTAESVAAGLAAGSSYGEGSIDEPLDDLNDLLFVWGFHEAAHALDIEPDEFRVDDAEERVDRWMREADVARHLAAYRGERSPLAWLFG